MNEVSPELRERSRKIETLLRNALAEVSQARVADKMGVSESTVSRIKDTEIERMALFMASLNLRLVEADQLLISAQDLQALRHLAARGLPHVGRVGAGA